MPVPNALEVRLPNGDRVTAPVGAWVAAWLQGLSDEERAAVVEWVQAMLEPPLIVPGVRRANGHGPMAGG